MVFGSSILGGTRLDFIPLRNWSLELGLYWMGLNFIRGTFDPINCLGTLGKKGGLNPFINGRGKEKRN